MTIALDAALLFIPAVFLTLPVVWAWRFVGAYRRSMASSNSASTKGPRVLVVLPLRGADPFLRDCLEGLLHQNYDDYRIHVIIDSEVDPAWNPVREALANACTRGVPIQVDTLQRPLPTCSLKVSALIQATSTLDDTDEVVVLIDADATPARNWLRCLTAPMVDPKVGAVNGNRWFVPRRAGWGSLVRRLWNAGSISQMLAFSMPWGGSLAVRARLFRETDIKNRLARSFCDDSGVGDALRALSLRLEFAPGATMINREVIGLADCFGWLRRQLLCPRLDMACWPGMLAANVGMLASLGFCIGLCVAGMLTGMGRWSVEAGALLAWYTLGMLSALVVGEPKILRAVQERGQDATPMLLTWKLLPAFVLTHLMHFGSLAYAVIGRRVCWRGATYAIDGPGRVRLLEVQPYRAARVELAPDRSIL
jgi:hypothetical protein